MDESRVVRLSVSVNPRGDDAETELAAQRLLDELHEAEDRFQVLRRSSAREGAKDAGQVISAGQIVLAVLASGGALTSVITAIQAWLLRHAGTEIELDLGGDKLRLKGASDHDLQELIRAFAQRHAN